MSEHPPSGRAAEPRNTNGPAVAAMILGILAVIFEWLGLLTLAMAVLAIVLGVTGISRSQVSRTGRGQGIAGVVLGAAALVAYLAWGIATAGVLLVI